MSGILRWHETCARYRTEDLEQRYAPEPPRRTLRGPSGLGTAGARIPATNRL
jgi:hypothetical protein